MKNIIINVLKIVLIMVFVWTIIFLYFEKASSIEAGCYISLPFKGHSGQKEPTPEQLQSAKGVGTIEWSEVTGGPKHISGSLTAPSQDDPETIVLRFLAKKKTLYGIEDPYRVLYKIKSITNQWTGYTTIHFGQIYKGVPVENRLVVSVASNGVISSIQGVYYPYLDLDVDVNPKVSAEEAKAIALPHELNCAPFIGLPEGIKPSETFVPWLFEPVDEELIKTIKPELLIWPSASKDYLLWHFRIKWWTFFVDAHNGVIRGALQSWYTSGLPLETSGETSSAGPNIEVSPISLDFGEIWIDQNSAIKEVIIANTGEGDLIITDISLCGSTFALREFSDSFPICIAHKESLTLQVCFSPTSLGVFEGTMVFASNDSHYPQFEITLQGKGSVPVLNTSETQDMFYYPLPYYTFWPNLSWPYENMKKNGILAQGYDLSWPNLSPYNYFAYSNKNYYPTFLYLPFTDFLNLPLLELQYRTLPMTSF